MTASYFQAANKLLQEGKLNEAVATYRQAIEQNPNFHISHHNLGEALVKLGHFEEAAVAYRSSLNINPTSPWSYNKLGEVLTKLGHFDEAVICFRKAIEIKPDLSRFHNNLNDALTKQCNLNQSVTSRTAQVSDQQDDEVITNYRHDLELNPNSAMLHHLLGNSLAQQQRWGEAITFYRSAMELYSSSDALHYHLGLALAQIQQLDEAVACFGKAVELNPEAVEYREQLNYVLQKPLLDQEIANLRRAIEVKPDGKSCQILGQALIKQGKVEDAIAAYQKAALLEPETTETYLILGNLLTKQDKVEDAIALYQKAVLLEPEVIETYLILGNLLTKQGKVEDAIALYQKAVLLQPDSVEFYWDLVWLLSQQNQWDEAISFYSRACEVKPEGVAEHFPKNSKYTFIKLLDLTEQDRVILDQAGLSLEQLELIKIDCLEREEIYINSFGDSPKITLNQLGLPAFQHSILETGYIYSICPISQEIIRSNQSFFVFTNPSWQIIFYRFVGSEVFYLMVGFYPQSKGGIYFPNRGIIISFIDYSDPAFNLFGENEFKLCVDELKIYTLTFLSDVNNYLTNNKPKEVATVLGFVPNVGHYFWDDVPAIQTLYETGKIDKVSKFIIGVDSYISIGDIFSEIPSEKLKESIAVSQDKSAPNTLFKTILNNNYFALRLSSEGVIKQKLVNRICNFSTTKCSEVFLQKVSESKKHFPLLWITLRSHNRVWISQVEGIAKIINSLSKDFPDVGVIFDGMRRETDNLEKIRKLLHSPIKVYSALDCTIYETIVWVHAIDLCIEPVGAGLIFPILANKTGVYHSHKGWTPLDPSWVPQRENGVSLIQVHKDSIVNSYDSAYHGLFYRNYDCDWKAIYNEVIKILEQIKKVRGNNFANKVNE